MPTQRLSMRRIREVLRLRHQGLTERVIARMLGVSNGVVHGYVRRARLAGLSWPLSEGLDDEAWSCCCSRRRWQPRKATGDRPPIGFMWRRSCAAVNRRGGPTPIGTLSY
jgi:hypothetical protein